MINLKDKLHERVFVPVKHEFKVAHKIETKLVDYLKICGHFDSHKNICTPAASFEIKDDVLIEKELLKQAEQSYIFTPEELLELKKEWMSEAWDYSREISDNTFGYGKKYPDKTEYINNLKLD